MSSLCDRLTFQSVPSAVSPNHCIKLKVSNRVISWSDCSPPSQH